jgi:hypothetical protein
MADLGSLIKLKHLEILHHFRGIFANSFLLDLLQKLTHQFVLIFHSKLGLKMFFKRGQSKILRKQPAQAFA